MAGKSDDSGMLVYPRLPVPRQRASEPKLTGGDGNRRRGRTALVAVLVLLAAGGGAVAGYVLKPVDRSALTAARTEIANLTTAARIEKDRADGAAKQVEVLSKDKQRLEQKLAETGAKLAEVDKKVAEAMAAAQQKLAAAVDSSGTVSREGDEIRLQLVDKVLFAVGDDQLTDKGKAVLAKVGKALADLPDKQIWVQGHTDDTPIPSSAPPRPARPAKGKKASKSDPAAAPAGPRFSSNWELSAARALQVVHYLQDTAKIDPTRLAALAFGEYRPVSRTNKALNRRIEIVLYPHRAVIERDPGRPPASKR